MRNLRKGDSGPDVRAVQQALNLRQSGDLKDDGAFGNNTDAAVRSFQDDAGLVDDGVVGPLTRAKLFPLAAVTGQAYGMRLEMPSFPKFGASDRPNVFNAGLTFGDPPPPPPAPSLTPSLGPSYFYTPLRYPLFPLPVSTPATPPPSTGLEFPINHFELAPGFSGGLLPGNRRVGGAFSLSISAIGVVGDEERTHDEVSTGVLTSNDGSGWTIFWMTQFTHVHQLNRAGNFSWQPNAQILAPFGSGAGGPSLGLSPFVFQWDANDDISLSLGGPSATFGLNPNDGTASIGLFTFGAVYKFGADPKKK